MNATERGFLDDIRRNPNDDTIRLIYADWLEVHAGQPERAAFIRGAVAVPHCEFIELTKDDPFPLLGIKTGEPQKVGFGESEQWRTWMWGETDKLGVVVHDLARRLDYKVRRGLVVAMMGRCEDLMRHGELVKRWPVTRVVMTDKRPAHIENYNGWNWGWFLDEGGKDCLPEELYERLADISPHLATRMRCYPTEPHANDALSNAFLSWAMSQ